MDEPGERARMGLAAREQACALGWNGVFGELRGIYQRGLGTEAVRRRMTPAR
jgi:hypothetical protein